MDFLRLSKITIYSLISIILLCLGLYGFINTLNSWHLMDLNYDHKLNNAIPVDVQFYRVLSYGSLLLSLFIWTLIFINIWQIENPKLKKIYLFSGGIFTWILAPFTIWKCWKNDYYLQYFKYISQNYTDIKTIDFLNKDNKKLLINTILGVLVWLISIVGFLFLFLTEYDYDQQNPNTNFLIGELSYFTNLNNWGITFFMTFYLIFNRKLVFKNNTIMIGMSVYIFVVFMIFWLALFPWSAEGIEKDYALSTKGPTRLISTIWVHAITPFFFILFSINSLLISKEKPKSFLKTLQKLIIFPILYGLYVFILPLFTQFSVYGWITNLNPNCVPYYDAIYNDDEHHSGDYLNLLILFGLLALFIFLIFVFWFISIKISKSNLKENLR